MAFNIAERISQIRAVEARLKQMEEEYEEKAKPLRDFAFQARTSILQYLNDTGQKSAATVNGTAYWRPKVTYRVMDKDEFRRHVIGTEEWELATWAAAGSACEAWVQANNAVPPGLERNAVNMLYINAPPKPRTKPAAGGAAPVQPEEEPIPQQETL